jgi:hypothetical protein
MRMYKWNSRRTDDNVSRPGTSAPPEDDEEDDTIAKLEAQRRERRQKGLHNIVFDMFIY